MFRVIILLFVHLFTCGTISHALITISVEDRNMGTVNRDIFGTNMLAYDPSTYENWDDNYTGYSDFGAGVWDCSKKTIVSEPIRLAKEAGIRILRFPGGCGAHHYDWKKSIGARIGFLYGLDEFLLTADELGASIIFTVSEYEGNESDAADLVRCVKNKYSAPGKKVFYEFGNESWHGDHRKTRSLSPEKYAALYLRYYNAMKLADPSIKIGVVLSRDDWNRRVLSLIKDRCDFGVIHSYAKCWLSRDELRRMEAKDIFSPMFEQTRGKKKRYAQISSMLADLCGKKVPLAITEFNAMFPEGKKTSYRHTLGAALLNAELLNIFMDPANNISMAAHWQYANSYFGMVSNGFDGTTRTLYRKYHKRPTYYVFQMYKEHFGDVLLACTLDQGSLLSNISVNASVDKARKKIYLMVVNPDTDNNIEALIKIKNFNTQRNAKAYTLTGPTIDSTNETKRDNVGLSMSDVEPENGQVRYSFPPHSLTALEIPGEYVYEAAK